MSFCKIISIFDMIFDSKDDDDENQRNRNTLTHKRTQNILNFHFHIFTQFTQMKMVKRCLLCFGIPRTKPNAFGCGLKFGMYGAMIIIIYYSLPSKSIIYVSALYNLCLFFDIILYDARWWCTRDANWEICTTHVHTSYI